MFSPCIVNIMYFPSLWFYTIHLWKLLHSISLEPLRQLLLLELRCGATFIVIHHVTQTQPDSLVTWRSFHSVILRVINFRGRTKRQQEHLRDEIGGWVYLRMFVDTAFNNLGNSRTWKRLHIDQCVFTRNSHVAVKPGKTLLAYHVNLSNFRKVKRPTRVFCS